MANTIPDGVTFGNPVQRSSARGNPTSTSATQTPTAPRNPGVPDGVTFGSPVARSSDPVPEQPGLFSRVGEGVKQSVLGSVPGAVMAAVNAVNPASAADEQVVYAIAGAPALAAYRAAKGAVNSGKNLMNSAGRSIRKRSRIFIRQCQIFAIKIGATPHHRQLQRQQTHGDCPAGNGTASPAGEGIFRRHAPGWKSGDTVDQGCDQRRSRNCGNENTSSSQGDARGHG
jgi:hypothetical protein